FEVTLLPACSPSHSLSLQSCCCHHAPIRLLLSTVHFHAVFPNCHIPKTATGTVKDPLLPGRGRTASPCYTSTITPAPSTPQLSHPHGLSITYQKVFIHQAPHMGVPEAAPYLWQASDQTVQLVMNWLTQVKQSVPLLGQSLRVPPFIGKTGLSWALDTSLNQVSELREEGSETFCYWW
uniref:Uncharacterized protein n=1 Tax=Strigops habroptila TaxID=2489341 RepID=A0A672UF00_STRHB